MYINLSNYQNFLKIVYIVKHTWTSGALHVYSSAIKRINNKQILEAGCYYNIVSNLNRKD